jgi:hypothetical protein
MIGIAKTGSGKTIAFGVPSVVHVLGMFVAGVERLETFELSRLTWGSLLLRQKFPRVCSPELHASRLFTPSIITLQIRRQ